MNVKMCFLYGDYNSRNHAKSQDLCDLVIYSIHVRDNEFDKFYLNDSNWKLILSNNQGWVWKPDEEELIEIPVKSLTFKSEKRAIKYKYFKSIEKKYLKAPYTIDEIIKCLEFKNNKTKEKIKDRLLISGSTNFYTASWVQNC